jgi:hypothetical protein
MKGLAVDFDWKLVPSEDRDFSEEKVTEVNKAKPVAVHWKSRLISHSNTQLLRLEMKRTLFLLVIPTQLLAFSFVLAFFTAYWVLLFLLAIPFTLRYLSHIATILIALRRDVLDNGKEK